jgi:hypothetical protein
MVNHGYEIQTTADFFRKLLDEREDFLKNPTSSRHAINCALTGWHIYEWVYTEYRSNPFIQQFKKAKKFEDWLLDKHMEFKLIRDLADGSKHFHLGRPDKSILGTHIKRKRELYGSRPLAEDTLIIQMKFMNGAWMSFDDLFYWVTIFWYEFLKRELGIDTSRIMVDGNYTFF